MDGTCLVQPCYIRSIAITRPIKNALSSLSKFAVVSDFPLHVTRLPILYSTLCPNSSSFHSSVVNFLLLSFLSASNINMTTRSGTASSDTEKESHEQRAPQAGRSVSDPDQISSVPQLGDPFATPNAQTPVNSSPHPSNPASRTPSRQGSSKPEVTSGNSSGVLRPGQNRYFKSRRIKKGEVERPWLEKKDPNEKWVTIIPIVGVLLGLAVAGVIIWDGLRSVTNHKYCPVLDETFASGWNDQIWSKEVEVGGYG